MYFKKLVSVMVCVSLAVLIIPYSFAGEIDILVDKLVDKNILTRAEADEILTETRAEVKKELEQAKSSSSPAWAQKIKLNGDFRLRHQYERQTTDTEGRNRGRIRLRVGAEAKVIDQVKIGFGLATGGTDPKSTNYTLENNFETPDIRLDYAFAEYSLLKGKDFKIVGGKIKRKPYLWHATDLLWDGDIRPEGGAMHWQDALLDFENTEYWINGGLWVLDSNDQVDKPDPFMTYVQTGLKDKGELFDRDVDSKVAVTYYNFQGVKGNSMDDSEGQNSTDADGLLLSTYNSIAVSGEFGVKELFGGLPFDIDERIAVFGDFVHNFDDEAFAVEKTTGWAIGTKFGNKKVKDKGQWQAKYIYAILGADAWVDAFPDADRGFGGETDIRSHEAIVEYGLSKNIKFGIDYYNTRRYSASSASENNVEHIVQSDLLFKF